MARTKETERGGHEEKSSSVNTAAVMWELRQAAFEFLQSRAPKPEKVELLKLPSELLPGLQRVATAAYEGDTAALQDAVNDPDFQAAGGVPKDLLVWTPLPHAKYDGRDGTTTTKFLAVIRILCSNGAAIKEGELLAACQRFGIKEPPHCMSNTSLNTAVAWSCHHGFVPIFQFLRENGASTHVMIGDTCSEGHIDMLRYMLSENLLPSPAEAHEEGSQAHTTISEAFSYADMSRQSAVVDFLTEQAGYSRAIFSDHGERSELM